MPNIRRAKAHTDRKRKRDVKDVLKFKPVIYNVDVQAGLGQDDPGSKFSQMMSLKKRLDKVDFVKPDGDGNMQMGLSSAQASILLRPVNNQIEKNQLRASPPPRDKGSFYAKAMQNCDRINKELNKGRRKAMRELKKKKDKERIKNMSSPQPMKPKTFSISKLKRPVPEVEPIVEEELEPSRTQRKKFVMPPLVKEGSIYERLKIGMEQRAKRAKRRRRPGR